jgi:hypothetical protein
VRYSAYRFGKIVNVAKPWPSLAPDMEFLAEIVENKPNVDLGSDKLRQTKVSFRGFRMAWAGKPMPTNPDTRRRASRDGQTFV